GIDRPRSLALSSGARHAPCRDAIAERWRALLHHRERRAFHRHAGLEQRHRRRRARLVGARPLRPSPAADERGRARRDARAQSDLAARASRTRGGARVPRRGGTAARAPARIAARRKEETMKRLRAVEIAAVLTLLVLPLAASAHGAGHVYGTITVFDEKH